MPLFVMRGRRDPWWEADGPAARRERRRRRARGMLAFAVSLVAVAGAALEWSLYLGLAQLAAAHLGMRLG